MSQIARILVAIKDPWARSLPAADKAVQLARSLGAEVRLFHALSDPVLADVREMQDFARLERERRERALARLTTIAKRLKRGVAVTVAAEWDFPAYEAVIRAAQKFKADLIVAELHPTSHRLPWLLRFNDFELLRLAPMAVLLVKSRRRYTRPAVLAALDPGQTRAKPAGLDARIVRYASTVSRALRGAMHAVYAYNFIVSPTFPRIGAIGMIGTAAIDTTARSQARKALDRVLRPGTVARSRRHVVAGFPADAIDEVARKTKAGIVVMGAISRSGARRLVFGNTADKLLDRLPCDVLVVKPVDFPNRVPKTLRGSQMIVHSSVQAGF